MWESRDLALVILFAVTNFVYTVFIGQIAWLFTGIPGSNYLFSIGFAIIISLALLMYQGRRWRFLLQNMLFAILVIPTYFGGIPFDILARIPIIINALQVDIVCNSIYGFFKRSNKLRWWAIISTLELFLISPFVQMLNFYLFYLPTVLATFVNVILLMLPVIIIEGIAGAIIGYKLYQRIEKVGRVAAK